MTPHSTDAGTFIVGLVGGIGSGKSTVARAFGDLGCYVIDFDAEARRVLKRPEVARQLASWWGDRVYSEDGSVDRAQVARLIFADANQRRRLEALVHPLVWRTRSQAIEEARGAMGECPGVIFDAPLLIEAGLDRECDRVVFVEAPRPLRLDRVRSSRGWDEAEFDQRERWQMALEAKQGRCDLVIHNGGAGELLVEQVAGVFAIIRGAEQADET